MQPKFKQAFIASGIIVWLVYLSLHGWPLPPLLLVAGTHE